MDFCDLLEIKATTIKKLLILGDFNIHVDVSENVPARKFTSILDDANIHQYVNGHTLDLVISRSSDDLVQDMEVSTLMTDHNWVHFGISALKPSWPTKVYHTENICTHEINQDKISSPLVLQPADNADDLTEQYNKTLSIILATILTKTVRVRLTVPWYGDEIREAKRERKAQEEKMAEHKASIGSHKVQRPEKNSFTDANHSQIQAFL